jgi:hypothetical protein
MRHLSRIVVAALLRATALPSGALARQPGNIGSTARRVHDDGQIWSHALWNLRTALGHAHADTAVLLTQIGQDNPTMPSLATDIVQTVRDLYGVTAATAARAAFEDRGIPVS